MALAATVKFKNTSRHSLNSLIPSHVRFNWNGQIKFTKLQVKMNEQEEYLQNCGKKVLNFIEPDVKKFAKTTRNYFWQN